MCWYGVKGQGGHYNIPQSSNDMQLGGYHELMSCSHRSGDSLCYPPKALGPMSYYCLCTLQIHFDPDQTGPRLLIEAVDDAGFDAEVVETDRCVQAE